MSSTKRIYEDENVETLPDPESIPISDRKLLTQPYDLVVSSLLSQIEDGTLYLLPLSDRPSFQRRYVWTDKLASRLIESILLNVPIPPVYLSQNEDFELDVIDGQQRIYSIYRYANNQFKLTSLEVLTELNGLHFYELPSRLARKLETYVLRCVIITNDSHPEIRFDVFERLNTNTMPLNAQEIRNCIYRGPLIDLLVQLAIYEPWLRILNRSSPDKRMRGEELVLRFFAFQIKGVDGYRTPQKHWLNDVAKKGMKFPDQKIVELDSLWKSTIDECLTIFEPNECFRRPPLNKARGPINRALMDLVMSSVAHLDRANLAEITPIFRERYDEIINNEEFEDLITRAIDHKSRTIRRFELWEEHVLTGLS